jgi:ketosteroid isomerase-like protein
MMQPIARWIAAYNAGASLPEDIFTDDVVITDQFPPFVWSGKDGERRWAGAIDRFIRPGKQHVSVGPAQQFMSAHDGTDVSFVLPATLTLASSRGQSTSEHALWLFVLVHSGTQWKIVADTWTPSPTPSLVSVPLIQEHGVLYVRAQIGGVGRLLLIFDPGGEDVYTTYAWNQLNRRSPQRVCLSTACFSVAMQVFEGDPSELDPRHDQRDGVIAGSLGPALLQHYVTTIDYRASLLTLSDPNAFRPSPSARRLSLSYDSYALPIVQATVDGITASFELDVRAPTSMLFRPFLDRTGLGRSYAGTPIVQTSTLSVAHAVRSVRISGFELRDTAFWFSTATSGKFGNASIAGLLGNNVLSHFLLTLDISHSGAYLAPRVH